MITGLYTHVAFLDARKNIEEILKFKWICLLLPARSLCFLFIDVINFCLIRWKRRPIFLFGRIIASFLFFGTGTSLFTCQKRSGGEALINSRVVIGSYSVHAPTSGGFFKGVVIWKRNDLKWKHCPSPFCCVRRFRICFTSQFCFCCRVVSSLEL